jgi:Asp-tRNA(Asn)/Glu-tRNA(Gln) amidotransferase C subunit
MFTKKVTDDDNFMALSSSAQALYLHLSMSADDDGFCNQVSISMFKAHASIQDLQALLEKRYIYQFDNGVIVIKHWRMANALRKDRYTPTAFQEELSHLDIKDNGSYTWLPSGCQTVAKWLPQDSIGKDRLDKNSLVEDIIDNSAELQPASKKQKHKYGEYQNVLLTDEELEKLKTEYSDYAERIERLSSYVASTGKKYKSHYATIRNWARKDTESPRRKEVVPDWMKRLEKAHSCQKHDYDFEELEKALAPVMVDDDPTLRAEAEALKKELQEKY